MAITGVHALFYTPEADAVRAMLRDVMGWDSIDVHDGWLIFRLPPAELAVHPGETTQHELSFMCDDIAATVADLSAKGITFKGDPQPLGAFGVGTTMVLPGGVEVLLYEPRHETAI